MPWDLLQVGGGLVLLFLGGEGLVRGSVSLAEEFGISKLVVGMVIVGFGTSAPELLVSVQAALLGSPEIAIGNVVGSNIANILLVIGVAGLIAPIANGDSAIRRDVIVMLGASLGLLALLWIGVIGRYAGLGMLALLTLYLLSTYRIEKKRRASAFTQEADVVDDLPLSAPKATVAVILGLALLVLGADLMVEGATALALRFGVSEAVIGLTIVAVGTSLPELATAIVASLRRHADVILANVIGSNIFNVLCILGTTALVQPIEVARKFAVIDGPIMVGVALAALLMFFLMKRIGRPTALALLLGYSGYTLLQAVGP